MDQKQTNKAKEILTTMTVEELSYTLGRYCGPYNTLLSMKKFDLVMPKRLVEEILATKSFELYLLEEGE